MTGFTTAQLDELERRGLAGAGNADGVCSIDAAELLELVAAYRVCVLFGELCQGLVQARQAGPGATPAASNVLECIFCKCPQEFDSPYCESHLGGRVHEGDHKCR